MVRFYKKNGKAKGDISGYCQTVTWSGQDTQVSRTCSFEIINAPNDKNVKDNIVTIGDIITLTEDENEIFRGEITNITKKDEIGTISVECKDYLNHLIRSNASYTFKKKTPQYITKKVCTDAGIVVGYLPDAKVTIPKMICNDWSMYKTIMRAWYKTFKQNGTRYKIKMLKNKLMVVPKGTIIQNYHLSRYVNLTSCERSESLDEMVNKVVIYDDKRKKIGVVTNDKSIKKYGVFQATYTKEENVNAKKHARNMLVGIQQEITATVINPPLECTAGNGVKVHDEETGLTGVYWIDEDTWTFENGNRTAELTLQFKNIMDTGG